jgi:hypothetical protein
VTHPVYIFYTLSFRKIHFSTNTTKQTLRDRPKANRIEVAAAEEDIDS